MVHLTVCSCHFALASSKEFLDIQTTIECGFTLKCLCDMTRTYSQIHCTDKYSEHSSIIWPVWPNGWVFIYELSRSGFESSRSLLNFRFHVCFEQRVPWHSGNYRVWIHSEPRTWHDKNKQSIKYNVLWVKKIKNKKSKNYIILIKTVQWKINIQLSMQG